MGPVQPDTSTPEYAVGEASYNPEVGPIYSPPPPGVFLWLQPMPAKLHAWDGNHGHAGSNSVPLM